MDHSEELYDCAVCDEKTSLRCGGCGELAFCSRGHQKIVRLSSSLDDPGAVPAQQLPLLQLWTTHKWLCGKRPDVFTFPPLSSDEERLIQAVVEVVDQGLETEEDSYLARTTVKLCLPGLKKEDLPVRFLFPFHPSPRVVD
jgi:hypothetical protein